MPAAGMPLKGEEDDGGEVLVGKPLVGKPLVGGGGRWRKTVMGGGVFGSRCWCRWLVGVQRFDIVYVVFAITQFVFE
ncbi:hypothetical protein Hanom_Chr16g01486431 [Helianthus anomalus]